MLLGGNLGSLLYGDVYVMSRKQTQASAKGLISDSMSAGSEAIKLFIATAHKCQNSRNSLIYQVQITEANKLSY